ncbi:hypothetical protein DJ527_00220 [Sulfolobus sp. F1]|nr:hypothetical protein DJ527_00220 [Sulfolobus sp. F1]
MSNSTYNYTFVNELKQGEFVIVNISIVDISNQNVTLYYSNFSIITSNGTYGSVVVPTTAFYDLNETGVSLTPLFQSTSSSVKLIPSYGVSGKQVIFVVPKGSTIEGIKVVERGISVGSTAISSSTLHYLSVIKLNFISNDSSVCISYNSSNPIYTISNVLNIKGDIVNEHITATVALTAVNISPSFNFTVTKGLIGKELPLVSINSEFLSYYYVPSSTPISLTIYLPPENYEGDINISFYFTYIPSWSIKVDAFINDTAEAMFVQEFGDSYFVYNISVSFVNPVSSEAGIEAQDFVLVTSAGTFNTTYVGNTHLATVTNDLYSSSVLNGSKLSYQLVFFVPVKAKPYYLVFRSQNGIVMDKIPVQGIKPIYFSLIGTICKVTNTTYVYITTPPYLFIYLYSGETFNITGYTNLYAVVYNYSIVGISVTPPFKLVGTYPKLIGVLFNEDVQFNVEIMAPNVSYYGNLTLKFYVVYNIPPYQSSSNPAAVTNIPTICLPAIIPLAVREKKKAE